MRIKHLSHRHLVWLFATAVACFSAAVHYPVLENNFVWDDRMFMVDSTIYSGEGGIYRSLFSAFALHAAYYRPFVVASFAILPAELSDVPMWHHAINLLLQALASSLVFVVSLAATRKFAQPALPLRLSMMVATGAALVFAVHPLVLESTYWISGRFDQVLTVVCLAFIYVDLRWTPSPWRFCVLSLLYFLAACSKETAVAFPLALAALHLMLWRATAGATSLREYARQQLSSYVAILLGGVIYLAFRFAVVGFGIGDSSALALSNGFIDRSLLAGLSLGKYVALLILPWSITAPLHPFDPLDFPAWYYAAPIVMVVVFGLVVALAVRRREALWPYPVFAFVAMLLPVMHMLTLSAAGNLIADRYALAPLAMLLVCTTPLITRFLSVAQLTVAFRWTLSAIFVILIASWIAFARVTVAVWHDDSTLWNYAFQRSPKSLLAAQNYVTSLLQRGQLDEAEVILRRILQQKTLSIAPLTNLALLRAAKGDTEDALRVLARIDERTRNTLISLDRAGYHGTYAQIYARTERWNDALRESRTALEYDPNNSTSRIVEASAMFALGDKEAAVARLLELRATSSAPIRARIDATLESWGMRLQPNVR